MGEDYMSNVINMSGQRSPYMRYADRDKGTASGPPTMGAKGNRSQHTSVIRGGNGPACTIVAKICYPNAGAEAGKTLRNLKRVQGPYSFELARAAASNSSAV
jgi:hypothetical protein